MGDVIGISAPRPRPCTRRPSTIGRWLGGAGAGNRDLVSGVCVVDAHGSFSGTAFDHCRWRQVDRLDNFPELGQESHVAWICLVDSTS